MQHHGRRGRGQRDHHHRRAGARRATAPGPGGVCPGGRVPVWLLHAGDDHVHGGAAGSAAGPLHRRDYPFFARQSLPLRFLSAHLGRGHGRGGTATGASRRDDGGRSHDGRAADRGCAEAARRGHFRGLSRPGCGRGDLWRGRCAARAGDAPAARDWSLGPHCGGRRDRGACGQGRGGAEHPHVAGADGGGGIARAGGCGAGGHGRHGPRAL